MTIIAHIVFPYRTRNLRGTVAVLPREAMLKSLNAVPERYQDNHFVVAFTAEGINNDEGYFCWFNDFWVGVGGIHDTYLEIEENYAPPIALTEYGKNWLACIEQRARK
jgi:hypothetical protein